MKMVVDAQEIAGARTGVPRVTLLDSLVFTQIFQELELLVSNKKEKLLLNSKEYQMILSCISEQPRKQLIVNPNRPENIRLWLLQSIGVMIPNKSIKSSFRYCSLFPGMYRESKNVKDVIRIHDPYRTLNQVGIKQVEFRKKKLVIARELRDKAFVEQLRKKSLMVANSQYTANQFSQNYSVAADRFNVIWPSVGFRSQESLQSDYSIQPRPYLLSVMSQRQRKDPVFVINSWAETADKVDLDLIVVGEIPLNLLSNASQKLLAIGKLRIYPHLLTNELIYIQKKAFASIFASRGEGFGLPLAESLFYGVPVIHNRLSVFEEVCGDVSTKFSIDDQDSLVQAILNLRQSEFEYKQIRLNSWKRGLQFSHEEAARKWSSLLF